MSFTTLGKRNHKILRQVSERGWVDGEPVEAETAEITIRANIQPATMSYQTQLLPSGFREKEAIMIYSNDWLYTSVTEATPEKADIVLYRGAKWLVIVSKPYGNFGEHCESLAVRLDDSPTVRESGTMGVIN